MASPPERRQDEAIAGLMPEQSVPVAEENGKRILRTAMAWRIGGIAATAISFHRAPGTSRTQISTRCEGAPRTVHVMPAASNGRFRNAELLVEVEQRVTDDYRRDQS
jgi:hypothetical protein